MLNTSYHKIVAVSILMFCWFAGMADSRVDSLWRQYHSVTESEKKAHLLFAIGDEYYAEKKLLLRDSIFQLALAGQYMQQNGSDAQLVAIYKWYFSKEYALGNKNALDYATAIEVAGKHTNNNEWLYDAYLAFYRIYFNQNKFDVALNYATRANYYANSINTDNLKAKSLLELGCCKERLNNKIDAFTNYKDALQIAYNINDDTLLYDAYGKLSEFFRIIKRYEEANEYKQKQFKMISRSAPTDSSKLMQLYDDFSNILFDSKIKEQPEKISETVIDYAYRHNDEELKNAAFNTYRSYLVENNLFNELSDLYTKKYPGELKKISRTSPGLYYRLKAYIEEANKHLDSSAYYYRLCENDIAATSINDIYTANFFRRYGQFLFRKGDTLQAKQKFEQSYHYALQAHYYPYIIAATDYLEAISVKEKNFTTAYEYQKQNRIYTDSQAITAKQDELLLMEIDNKNKQVEMEDAKTKAGIERRHNLEYLGIILFITSLFTVLVMLGFLKVSKFVIKSIGFFSFILLFEFIVMVTDTKVENFTHGEPWKILLFKLLIISILAPIHHWLEHTVIDYLYDHKLLDSSKMRLRKLITRIREKVQKEKTAGK